MQITKDIIGKINNSNTPFTIVKSLTAKGINNAKDLSRLSGISISHFAKLNVSYLKKSKTTDIIGVSLKQEEFHFYEIISNLISKGLIKNIEIDSEKQFIKSLLNCDIKEESDNFIKLNKSTILFKSIDGINLDSNKLILKPSIGGLFKSDFNKSLDDLSLNQLDILFKGIVQRNPNYTLLDTIYDNIIKKIK